MRIDGMTRARSLLQSNHAKTVGTEHIKPGMKIYVDSRLIEIDRLLYVYATCSVSKHFLVYECKWLSSYQDERRTPAMIASMELDTSRRHELNT